ncbi:necrosis-inducing protein [Akanthomyces lecanii RCEF 1005]|uniref:Necrosis-inducing protein n=1 Tax=Akanthomyces lecanii RCEF 1005 TaxID=1081108 RepID=A0A168KLL3_CORDF|nr:necrosis-inducing protein [Akanthomyces lecanii RCEF 1005]
MQAKLIALSGMLAIASASPIAEISAAKRDVIGALDESADQFEIDHQPLLDFDSDGCYQTSAINKDGKTNPGHGATGTPQGDCRDPHQLDNANSYSRKRCNNGICATMYETYFEKDQSVSGTFAGGHRHDWENIVVFTKGNDVVRVAPSCHGKYSNARNDFPKRDNHPLLVYHKDGAGTHCYRFANDDDIAHPENPRKDFFRAPLIGWNKWPSEDLKNKMLNAFKGGVGPKLDDEFTDSLKAAAGDGVPGFDPAKDE